MNWSYRKSISAGPFRMNFSKSGISYSFGFKGASIKMGPKGTYVRLSYDGISYRQRISPTLTPPSDFSNAQPTGNINVASANIDQLTDSDSFDFISDLNEKCKKISYVKWLGVLPLVIYLFLLVCANQFSLPNPYLLLELSACLVIFLPLLVYLAKIDRRRFQMELLYEMDQNIEQVFGIFKTYFSEISKSARVWQYLNINHTSDFKRNAGAGHLIKRVLVRRISDNSMPLRHFITNVAIPHLSLTNVDLYFLPERLLVRRGDTFAAVFYKNLHISCDTTRFIEEEGLSVDAQVVDHTWRFVNKNGGPDRRFNNNRQLPICLYSQYTMTSGTGIFEIITTSKVSAMDDFAKFITRIGELQSRMAI